MIKRHTLRASSGSYFRSAHAPQRLEEVIEALTNDSIEQSLDEIEVAFRKHFRFKTHTPHEGKKLTTE